MNTNSNVYTVVYSAIMVVVVAIVLTVVSVGLKPQQKINMDNEKRINILKCAGIEVDESKAEETFNKAVVESFVVDSLGNKTNDDAFSIKDNLIVFKTVVKDGVVKKEVKLPIFKVENNGQFYYVVPLKGKGLWGAIWGYAALKEDFNTINGVVFAHASETPGLGAKMTEDFFTSQFVGKEMSENGKFVGVNVYKDSKKTAEDPKHGIDAISGSTMTTNGVKNMVNDCLQAYEPLKKTLSSTSASAPAVDNTDTVSEPVPDAPAADTTQNVIK